MPTFRDITIKIVGLRPVKALPERDPTEEEQATLQQSHPEFRKSNSVFKVIGVPPCLSQIYIHIKGANDTGLEGYLCELFIRGKHIQTIAVDEDRGDIKFDDDISSTFRPVCTASASQSRQAFRGTLTEIVTPSLIQDDPIHSIVTLAERDSVVIPALEIRVRRIYGRQSTVQRSEKELTRHGQLRKEPYKYSCYEDESCPYARFFLSFEGCLDYDDTYLSAVPVSQNAVHLHDTDTSYKGTGICNFAIVLEDKSNLTGDVESAVPVDDPVGFINDITGHAYARPPISTILPEEEAYSADDEHEFLTSASKSKSKGKCKGKGKARIKASTCTLAATAPIFDHESQPILQPLTTNLWYEEEEDDSSAPSLSSSPVLPTLLDIECHSDCDGTYNNAPPHTQFAPSIHSPSASLALAHYEDDHEDTFSTYEVTPAHPDSDSTEDSNNGCVPAVIQAPVVTVVTAVDAFPGFMYSPPPSSAASSPTSSPSRNSSVIILPTIRPGTPLDPILSFGLRRSAGSGVAYERFPTRSSSLPLDSSFAAESVAEPAASRGGVSFATTATATAAATELTAVRTPGSIRRFASRVFGTPSLAAQTDLRDVGGSPGAGSVGSSAAGGMEVGEMSDRRRAATPAQSWGRLRKMGSRLFGRGE